MATSVKRCSLISSIKTIETLNGSTITEKEITHNIKDEVIMTSGSSPDAEFVYSGTITSTTNLDLKDLSNTEGDTIDTDGKKVRAIKIKAASGNGNAMTFAAGASNGYDLLGASFTMEIEAGDHILFYFSDNAPAIGDTDKVLDFTFTSSQSCDIVIIFG